MVYATKQWTEAPKEWGIPLNPPGEFPPLIDPSLLRSAKLIYRAFREARPDVTKRPTGMVIDRVTHRGKLAFTSRPALLPRECFISIEHIEADFEVYA